VEKHRLLPERTPRSHRPDGKGAGTEEFGKHLGEVRLNVRRLDRFRIRPRPSSIFTTGRT
jgi:hypothetical protein